MNTQKSIITILLAVFILAMWSTPSPAKNPIPPLARKALFESKKLQDEKQYRKAASLIQAYVAKGVEEIPAVIYLVLGNNLHQAGDEKGALQAYIKGLGIAPNNYGLCVNAAAAHYTLKQYSKAGNLFERAHPVAPEPNPQLLYQAGVAFHMAKEYANADRVLTRLVNTANPVKSDWLKLTIHNLVAMKSWKRAEAMIMKMLNKVPGQHEYWKMLAKLKLEREDYSGAAAALEICYKFTKPSSHDLIQLAQLYHYVDAPLKAAKTYLRAGVTSKTAPKIANCYTQASRYKEGVHALSRSGISNSPLVNLLKGKLMFEARNFKEAECFLKKCVENDSKMAEAWLYLGLCSWEKKEWKTAYRHFQRAARDKRFKNQVAAALAALDDLEEARKQARNDA